MRSGLQGLAAGLLIVGPMVLAFQVKADQEEGTQTLASNRLPVVRIAVMTTDLDESFEGRARVDGEEHEVPLSAHDSAPQRVKGKTVLVFYNTTAKRWRFISDDLGQLSHEYREFKIAEADLPAIQ